MSETDLELPERCTRAAELAGRLKDWQASTGVKINFEHGVGAALVASTGSPVLCLTLPNGHQGASRFVLFVNEHGRIEVHLYGALSTDCIALVQRLTEEDLEQWPILPIKRLTTGADSIT